VALEVSEKGGDGAIDNLFLCLLWNPRVARGNLNE
jgi:hypothetical protein